MRSGEREARASHLPIRRLRNPLASVLMTIDIEASATRRRGRRHNDDNDDDQNRDGNDGKRRSFLDMCMRVSPGIHRGALLHSPREQSTDLQRECPLATSRTDTLTDSVSLLIKETPDFARD